MEGRRGVRRLGLAMIVEPPSPPAADRLSSPGGVRGGRLPSNSGSSPPGCIPFTGCPLDLRQFIEEDEFAMRVTLVNPPSLAFSREDLAPPLGLLTLAAALVPKGHEITIIDLNLESVEAPTREPQVFLQSATERIVETSPEVVGFTSMCMESHVALELADRTKSRMRGATVVVGGPHFGAAPQEFLANFPQVDFVVAGEAEESFLAVLAHLQEPGSRLEVPGVYTRGPGGTIVGHGVSGPRPDLRSRNALDLSLVGVERYFEINPKRLIYYEQGRGCVFKCSFCYSRRQFGENPRDRAPEQVAGDLRWLADRGAEHVFFVGDNFVNDRTWALEVCEAIANEDLPLTWSCYVTYPLIDEDLVDGMARANCVAIFTGVDAVSPEAQDRLNKRFARNWQRTEAILGYAAESGIEPTCAFILEGPTQHLREIDQTVRGALRLWNRGCQIRLNTLTVYNGTSLEGAYSERERHPSSAKVDLMLDAPPVIRSNPLAEQFPALFPYHSSPFSPPEWSAFVGKVHVLETALTVFPIFLWHYSEVQEREIWNLLEYVDDDYVDCLRGVAPESRQMTSMLRLGLELAKHAEANAQLAAALDRDTASLRLSLLPPVRAVELKVSGVRRELLLRPFAPTRTNWVEVPSEGSGEGYPWLDEPAHYREVIVVGPNQTPVSRSLSVRAADAAFRLSISPESEGQGSVSQDELDELLDAGITGPHFG